MPIFSSSLCCVPPINNCSMAPQGTTVIDHEVEGLQFLVEAGLLTCNIDSLVSPQQPATTTVAVILASCFRYRLLPLPTPPAGESPPHVMPYMGPARPREEARSSESNARRTVPQIARRSAALSEEHIPHCHSIADTEQYGISILPYYAPSLALVSHAPRSKWYLARLQQAWQPAFAGNFHGTFRTLPQGTAMTSNKKKRKPRCTHAPRTTPQPSKSGNVSRIKRLRATHSSHSAQKTGRTRALVTSRRRGHTAHPYIDYPAPKTTSTLLTQRTRHESPVTWKL